MKELCIQLLSSFIGAMGFAFLFGLKRKHIFWAAVGGLLAWAVYLGMHELMEGIFRPALIASLVATNYAEILARKEHCPTTLFVVPAIIPLVPGSFLYYSMECAVNQDFVQSAVYGRQTLIWALAIAAGISITTVFQELRTRREKQ